MQLYREVRNFAHGRLRPEDTSTTRFVAVVVVVVGPRFTTSSSLFHPLHANAHTVLGMRATNFYLNFVVTNVRFSRHFQGRRRTPVEKGSRRRCPGESHSAMLPFSPLYFSSPTPPQISAFCPTCTSTCVCVCVCSLFRPRSLLF